MVKMVVSVALTLCVFHSNEVVIPGCILDGGRRRNTRYGCNKTEERKGMEDVVLLH